MDVSRPVIKPKLTPSTSVLLMLVAVIGMSTAVLWIKSSALSTGALSASRLGFASLLLLPVMLWRKAQLKKEGYMLPAGWWCKGILAGLMFAGHLLTWAIGARMTGSANAALAVNTAPLVLPFLLFWLAKERVTSREIVGTLVAFLGLLVLTLSDAKMNAQHFKGDLICLGSMLFLAVYIALSRRHAQVFPSILFYSVPLYIFTTLFCLPFALNSEDWAPLFGENAAFEWLCVLGLVLIPTLLGHSLMAVALRVLRGQVVSIMSLGQFIPSAIFAALLFNEIPHWQFFVAAALVFTGGVIVIRAKTVI